MADSKLQSVQIGGIRTCNNVELSGLEGLTVLIGRNGAGKTNIMQTIAEAAKNATEATTKESAFTYELFDPRYDSSYVQFQFASGNHDFRYEFHAFPKAEKAAGAHLIRTLDLKESLWEKSVMPYESEWTCVFSREKDTISIGQGNAELQVGSLMSALPAIGSLLSQNDPTLRIVQPARDFLSAIRYYPLDEPNRQSEESSVVRHSEYAQWLTERVRSANVDSSVVMRLLFLFHEDTGTFEELKALMGEDGLGVIKDIEIQTVRLGLSPHRRSTKAKADDKADVFYFLRFLPSHGGDVWNQYAELSFGTRRLLRLVASLLVDKASVMLIEQPEDGIHPALLHKLIPLLRSYSDICQVILTSHSPAVLNRLSPSEVRIVDIHNGASVVRKLTAEEMEGAEQFMNEDGPLSDFLEAVQGGA